jgi:hypothetical protein
MFTASAPINLEFETEEKKLEPLAKSAVALSSGSSGAATEVLNETLARLSGSQTPIIAEVARLLNTAYVGIRASKAQETIVMPALGRDFGDFLTKGGTLPNYLQVQPGIYQQLVATMAQFNLDLEIIVAGIDATGAHIHRVTHPGTSYCLDKLGYDAIGSGGIHALTRLYLGAQTRHKGLLETVYAVYDAKRAAEVAPGVGKDTDLAVIDSSGISPGSRTVLDQLATAHAKAANALAPNLDGLKAALEGTKKNGSPSGSA